MKIKIAVVGCGHWGKNLVRNFYQIGSLHSVCDPDESLAKRFAEEFNAQNRQFDEILNDPEINALALAVPAPLHAEMSIKAMNKGKHIFVEKPIALNDSEVNKMIKVSKNNQVHLMVGHLLQYHPVFQKVRSLVEENKLGKLNYIYSHRHSLGKIRSEEDVVWSFAPHDISMILSLTARLPQTIKTHSSQILQPDIADQAILHLDFNDGLKGHVSVSWLHPNKEQKLVVIGDLGMLIFDDTLPWKEKLAFFKHTVDCSSIPPLINKADAEFLDVEQAEPLRNECKYFIDLILGKVQPLTDGIEGSNVLKVLEASSLSQSTDSLITL